LSIAELAPLIFVWVRRFVETISKHSVVHSKLLATFSRQLDGAMCGRCAVRILLSLLGLLSSILVELTALANALQDLLPVLVGLQLRDDDFAGRDTDGY
jgi:hypothetical protein